ncbi:MAG: hypothetical protein IKK62_10915 [Bacteroidaceae bacterium]|nr:hypothetical protein [Bacteroidaceae bacterium]
MIFISSSSPSAQEASVVVARVSTSPNPGLPSGSWKSTVTVFVPCGARGVGGMISSWVHDEIKSTEHSVQSTDALRMAVSTDPGTEPLSVICTL